MKTQHWRPGGCSHVQKMVVSGHFRDLQLCNSHLDVRKHKLALERETMFDKAKRGYAAKIIGERTQVPTVSCPSTASEGAVSDTLPPLEIGWSLKKPKKKTLFTAEQKQYLTEQVIIGEERGKIADPKDVSQEMHKLRDESGARLFRGKDVLTPQQVAGFFSRMVAKTQKSSSTQAEESESEDEKQHYAVEAESLRSKLHATVEEEIALQHPIVSLSRNICSLAREKSHIVSRN